MYAHIRARYTYSTIGIWYLYCPYFTYDTSFTHTYIYTQMHGQDIHIYRKIDRYTCTLGMYTDTEIITYTQELKEVVVKDDRNCCGAGFNFPR